MANYITLRHCTPAANLTSIHQLGLLPEKSKTAQPEVWLHRPTASSWAVLHTFQRHHCQIGELVILEVRVRRDHLQRRRRGLWSTKMTIPPSQINRLIPLNELM